MKQLRAFTLIELLVVISIIALLIAILLPALSSARQSAIQIQCASNNKQLGISANAYAAEYKGKFAVRDRTTSKYAGGFKHGPSDRWAEDYLTFMEGTFEDLPQLVLCPNTNNNGETWEGIAKPNWALSDYAYYPTYYERIVDGVGGSAAHWAARDDQGNIIKTATGLVDPSDSPLFGDSLYYGGGEWQVSAHPKGNDEGLSTFVEQAETNAVTTFAPEPGGGNQTALDGSVQWYDFSEYEIAAENFFGNSPQTWWVKPE